jgi:hypothetical protein
MKLEKLYLIEKWVDWNRLISDAIHDFFSSFSYYPNILEANEHTFSQFDFLVNEMPDEKQNAQRMDDGKTSKADENEYISLSSFENSCASVDFAVDNQLKDKEFRLVYDDEADWDEQEKQ